MRNLYTRPILILCLFSLFGLSVTAQDSTALPPVWPGDVDGNNEVAPVDLLYLGPVFGATGPARPGPGNDWNPYQAGDSTWTDTFPSGRNYAYADGNGNGRIGNGDLRLVSRYLGRTTGGPVTDSELRAPGGNSGIELSLRSAGIDVTADGKVLKLDVALRRNDDTLRGFYALAFDVAFGDDVLTESLVFDESNASVGNNNLVRPRIVETKEDGTLRFALTTLGFRNYQAPGVITQISVPLDDDFNEQQLANLGVTVTRAILMNKAFNFRRVAAVVVELTREGDCPQTVDPVCGDNGVTYLNSCFAEAAGVTDYTEGACWNAGLDFTAIDPDAICGDVYEPVCGFNGVTYPNVCTAEASGVTNYTTGVCGNNDDCYDKNLISVSGGTQVNANTGVITLTCDAGSGPVCGCDGESYPSACAAEAAGVVSYTAGNCSVACVDPAATTDTDNCPAVYEPVCGCNGTTYVNACYADAAGVQTYTEGPCGGTTTWCEEAVVISCGDYLPNQTTVNAGNQLKDYPGATSTPQNGPDRVYVFEKTTAGDLQVGLEILTSGLDMNLFVLRGDCNNFTVVGSSTSDNSVTNNEGIVIDDAPNGTYYIVVDQPAAGAGGEYRLELSCGVLDCSSVIPLTCSTPYVGTNRDGGDNVSAYQIGHLLNIENNGPEVLHSFTLTQTGPVSIFLTGLTADLELFLLSSCDRGKGIAFSQNKGTSDESILATLPPGTYYVVVDGYNGAISDYNLLVDCSTVCNLAVTDVDNVSSGCGRATGSYAFRISGGVAHYQARYHGPVSGSQVSNDGFFYLTGLPAGDYEVIIDDCAGCQKTFHFTIESSGSDLEGTITPIHAGCEEKAGAEIRFTRAGTPPYRVDITGDVTATLTTSSTRFDVGGLHVGTFTITVTDANGCRLSETITIINGGGTLQATVTKEDADCNDANGLIRVRLNDAAQPVRIDLSGPINGTRTVTSNAFSLPDLPGGNYTVKLTDASGCSTTEQVYIPGGNFDIEVETTDADCNTAGGGKLTITGGTPPFTVSYTGPSTRSFSTSDREVNLDDLPSGTYNFTVSSQDGCKEVLTRKVEDGGGNLNVTATQDIMTCGDSIGILSIIVTGGEPNYVLRFTGPVSGSVSLGGNGTGTLELPAGEYTLTVSDKNDCTTSTTAGMRSGLDDNDQFSFVYANGCGQLDNIRTTLTGGMAPYEVTITSDCLDTMFTTASDAFDLTDLDNCVYTIAVEDAAGCTTSKRAKIEVDPDDNILSVTPRGGACDGNGRIDLTVNRGDDPYFINWTGPISGSVNLAGTSYSLIDAPAGEYTFTLTNREGCDDTQTVTLVNDGNLEIVSSIVTDTICGSPYQIWNDIEGGTDPYRVTATRLCDDEEVDVIISGNGFEVVDLLPCCYLLEVEDDNGCKTSTEVCVPDYQLFDAIPTDGQCDEPGMIKVRINNDHAEGPFLIEYTGPVDGGFTTSAREADLLALPAGEYTITVTGDQGCTETMQVTVRDISSDLRLQTALIANDCGQYDQLWNDIEGGMPPYTVEVTRLCDNTTDTLFTTSDRGFELVDLEDCEYKVKVTDSVGCMVMTTRDVDGEDPDLVDVTAVDGACGEFGRIDIDFRRGHAPYMVIYTGPISGDNDVNGTRLTINDAPAGDYTLTITDAKGCEEIEVVTISETTSDLELVAAVIDNECGVFDQVWIDIFNGTGPYAVEVIRLCDSTVLRDFTSDETGFELFDLTPCEYKIVVTDAAGCMDMDVVDVDPAPVDRYDLVFGSGGCNEPGFFEVRVSVGTPPYTVIYNGPAADSITTADSIIRVENLPGGDYTVLLSDDRECRDTEQFTIENTNSDLDLVTSLIFNDCGQLNQLWNDINGGVPPFSVEVTRLCDNTTDTVFTTSEREFELFNREPCTYKLKVTDATGCMDMEEIEVRSTSADLIDLNVSEDCDRAGFGIEFTHGTAPYMVTVSGPTAVLLENVTRDTFVAATSGNYMVRVTSAEGCVETIFRSLDVSGNGGSAPVASFTFADEDGTISFTNASSTGVYSWDFGDSTGTSTDTDPTYTYATADTFTVCLTVTTDCGTDTQCQEVTVAGPGGSLTGARIVIGGATGQRNGRVSVPVGIRGVANLASLSGTFELTDARIATITGLGENEILPQFNEAANTFSYASLNPAGIDLDSSVTTVLFYLDFRLGGTLGSSDITVTGSGISFELSSMTNGLPRLQSISYEAGFVTVSANAVGTINSRAYTVADREMEGVNFMLSEEEAAYEVALLDNGDGTSSTVAPVSLNRMYYVEPYYDGDWREGLSTFEIFLGRRALLGMDVPQLTTPYQFLSTDMDCSGDFSNFDLYLMQLLILEQRSDLPGCDSWTFVPSDYDFGQDWEQTDIFTAPRRASIMLTGDTMTTFVGVKRGDLLGDVDPGRAASGELGLRIELPEALAAGEETNLAINLAEGVDLAALQLELELPAGLEIVGFNAGELVGLAAADALFPRNKLRLSWYDKQGLGAYAGAGLSVGELTVRATTDLSGDDLLPRLTDGDFTSEAHTADLKRLTPTLTPTHAEDVSGRLAVTTLAPNPATETTVLSFQLPVRAATELRVFDAMGRRVIGRNQRLEAGPQRLTLDVRQLPAGIYSYRLSAAGETAFGKLVVRR